VTTPIYIHIVTGAPKETKHNNQKPTTCTTTTITTATTMYTTHVTYRRRVHFRVGPYFHIALQQIVDQGRVFSAHFFKKHQPRTGRMIRLRLVHRLLPGQTVKEVSVGMEEGMQEE